MGQIVKIEKEQPLKKQSAKKHPRYREDPRAEFLMTGTNGFGRTVYFFQVSVTGLRRRVFGPFDSRTQAITHFDHVLEVALHAFCDVQNGVTPYPYGGMEHVELPNDLQVRP